MVKDLRDAVRARCLCLSAEHNQALIDNGRVTPNDPAGGEPGEDDGSVSRDGGQAEPSLPKRVMSRAVNSSVEITRTGHILPDCHERSSEGASAAPDS